MQKYHCLQQNNLPSLGNGNHYVLLQCVGQVGTFAENGLGLIHSFIHLCNHSFIQQPQKITSDGAGSVAHGVWNLESGFIPSHILAYR